MFEIVEALDVHETVAGYGNNSLDLLAACMQSNRPAWQSSTAMALHEVIRQAGSASLSGRLHPGVCACATLVHFLAWCIACKMTSERSDASDARVSF